MFWLWDLVNLDGTELLISNNCVFYPFTVIKTCGLPVDFYSCYEIVQVKDENK